MTIAKYKIRYWNKSDTCHEIYVSGTTIESALDKAKQEAPHTAEQFEICGGPHYVEE